MSTSDHVDSPDPLTLPSSPLSTHSAARRSTTPRRSQPLSQKSTNIRSSPAKSFIMDANAPGDASPWRIKVTVEAEPHSSPSKATGRVTRSTKVPLKISAEEETGSPSKKGRKRKPTPAKKSVETSDEDARPQRKRKGTPIRPRRKAQPAVEESAIDGESGGEAEDENAAVTSRPPPRSTAPRSSTTPKKRGFTPLKRPRSKRLSQARDELDEALREAVGDETQPSSEVGNMTMAENEDFTMVSIESLQSYKSKMAGNTTTTPDKTGVSVSYMASSPPPAAAAQYPDLTQPLEEATQAEPVAAYDAMSWKPTGPAKLASQPKPAEPPGWDPEPSEWQREREAVSQQIRNANTSQVIVINDSSHIHIHSPSPERKTRSSPGGEDIWAEEASRSLEEDQDVMQAEQEGSAQCKERSPQLEDLFSDQIQKPLRSKIPRTWRRISGNDFAYSDSPAHPPMDDQRKTSGSETGGSRRSSGVLTPPSTDDEVGKRMIEQGGEEANEGDSSGLTEPDGAATPFHGQVTKAKEHARDEQRDEALSPGVGSGSASDSSGNITSPDGEDTGMFWQSNMPQVYKRPERPRYVREVGRNLSELLGPDTSAVDSTNVTISTNDSSRNPVVYRSSRAAQFRERQQANAVRKQANEGKVRNSPNKGKAINSPLRKSLLKSSKIGGSPLSKSAVTRALDHTNSEVVDSFQSKASDQCQLLGDVQASVKRAKYATVESEETSLSQSEDSYIDNTAPGEYTAEDEPTQDPSQSYEEHLNLDSPQKIRVKFNDSLSWGGPTHDAEGNSFLLSTKQQYPPLFSPEQQKIHVASAIKSPPTVTLVSKKAPRPNALTAPTTHTNFLAKLSSTFWTAITTPQIYPPPPPSQPRQLPAYRAEPPFPSQLRTHLRSRYGVLRNTHPWTLAHMRTLHRMHNSCSSGKVDSIIPNPLTAWQTLPPLPFHLAELVGSEQAVLNGNGSGSGKGGETYTFSEQDAFVVVSFMEVLVEEEIVGAMAKGEIEMLGDGTARALRGRKGGRDGGERLWKAGWGAPKDGSVIEWGFVVGALGAVGREEGRLQRLAAERV